MEHEYRNWQSPSVTIELEHDFYLKFQSIGQRKPDKSGKEASASTNTSKNSSYVNLQFPMVSEKPMLKIKGWNVIISKDRAQKGKRKAKAAAAIADGWNIKDKPYQALS